MRHHKSGRLPVRHKSVVFSLSLAQAQQRRSCLGVSLPSRSSPFIRRTRSCGQVQRKSTFSLSFTHSFPLSFSFWFCSRFYSFSPSRSLALSPPPSPSTSLSLPLLSKHCLFHMARIMSGEAKREETRLTIRMGTLTEGFK